MSDRSPRPPARTRLDPARVAAAVARAVAECHARFRAVPGFGYPDAWLAFFVRGVPYDEPGDADADGFVAAGEVRNHPSFRTGYVLIHRETGEEWVDWVEGCFLLAPAPWRRSAAR